VDKTQAHSSLGSQCTANLLSSYSTVQLGVTETWASAVRFDLGIGLVTQTDLCPGTLSGKIKFRLRIYCSFVVRECSSASSFVPVRLSFSYLRTWAKGGWQARPNTHPAVFGLSAGVSLIPQVRALQTQNRFAKESSDHHT
jgi:hypothetical protein